MGRKLSAQHKAKISRALKAYHKKCKGFMKKNKSKPKRRVALTSAKPKRRVALTSVSSGGGGKGISSYRTKGLQTYGTALARISKNYSTKDTHPSLAF